MKRERCMIEGCDEIATHKTAGLCGACYSGLYYWRNASPTELVKHTHKLRRCEGRMKLRLGNVRPLLRRKSS